MHDDLIRINGGGTRESAVFSEYVVKKRRTRGTLVDTPPGILGVVLSNTTPTRDTLPGGSRVKGKARLSSEQTNIPLTKLIRLPIFFRVNIPITQRSETSLPKKNKGSRLLTKH